MKRSLVSVTVFFKTLLHACGTLPTAQFVLNDARCSPSQVHLSLRPCAESSAYLRTSFVKMWHNSRHWFTGRECKLRPFESSTPCPEKKETKMFSVILPTKLGQMLWNLAHSFLNKFAATWRKRFPPHLNNVSTLPCETWNDHRAHATIALLDKIGKLQNLSHLNCGPQIRKIWIQLITACGKYCKKMYKHASPIWSYRRRRWRMAAKMTTWSSLFHSISSRCFSSSRSVMRIFTSSLAIFPILCNQLDSNLMNLEATVAVG